MAETMEILVADDVRVIRNLLRVALERWGHRVTVAEDGREAVEVARQGHFDLALLDVDMPALDGRAAQGEIAANCPGTICVLMTGGVHDSPPADGGSRVTLLHKPFALDALRRVVEETRVSDTFATPGRTLADGDRRRPPRQAVLTAWPPG